MCCMHRVPARSPPVLPWLSLNRAKGRIELGLVKISPHSRKVGCCESLKILKNLWNVIFCKNSVKILKIFGM
jgi:hypothetical protein